MSVQIAVRLDHDALVALDTEVAEGRAANRSDAIRRSIARLQRRQRQERDVAVLTELQRRGEPVYPEAEAWLAAPRADGGP